MFAYCAERLHFSEHETYRRIRVARAGLELHHDGPHARNGDRTPENIRLLCRAHNRILAEREFAYEVMDRYRRPDRVRERAPAFTPGSSYGGASPGIAGHL